MMVTTPSQRNSLVTFALDSTETIIIPSADVENERLCVADLSISGQQPSSILRFASTRKPQDEIYEEIALSKEEIGRMHRFKTNRARLNLALFGEQERQLKAGISNPSLLAEVCRGYSLLCSDEARRRGRQLEEKIREEATREDVTAQHASTRCSVYTCFDGKHADESTKLHSLLPDSSLQKPESPASQERQRKRKGCFLKKLLRKIEKCP